MRSLKKRPRSDKIPNDIRHHRSTIGKRIYLGTLIIFAVVFANYLWGDFLILRSDGLVLRDKSEIAATSVSRVASIHVDEGQTVNKGDVLLRIESAEVLERLADLSIRQAELAKSTAELQLRSEISFQLLPLAVRREEETTRVLTQFESMSDRGLLTSARYDEALRANFTAREDRVRLAAESRSLKAQIAALGTAQKDAASAIADLQSHYADGTVLAPANGSIGTKVPSAGSVFNAGDPILTVYSGDEYVLTYLPKRYLFPIKTGMEVVVSSGRYRSEGAISEILPLSDALPQEFQNTFKPRDRNQLAKIKLHGSSVFPIYEKVLVTRKYF